MTTASNPIAPDHIDRHNMTMIACAGPILILGPPGSGKGTQSAKISSCWNIPRIATGDLLRVNVLQGTHLGKVADEFIRSGQLVPDDLISKMIAERLEKSDTNAGFVLDGFPRTVAQAIWLDNFLDRQSQLLQPLILNLQVDIDCLVSRITGRTVCRLCGTTYHREFCPPRSPGLCDLDGTPLEQRTDDVPQVLRERLKVYQAQTQPIIERYRHSSYFFPIDGDRPVQTLTETILNTIRHSRGLQN